MSSDAGGLETAPSAGPRTEPPASTQKHVGRRQWAIIYAISTFILMVLVSWLVGVLATKPGEPFDWSVSSAAATAVATIALAGGTFILAATALEDAGAARALAFLTAEDMRLRDRPIIRVADYRLSPDKPLVRFTLMNVGLGPATYVTVNVSGFDSEGDAVLTTGSLTITQTILPNDSLPVEIPFFIRGNYADLAKTELFMVTIDRRGNTSYALWREIRDVGFFVAASDSDSDWTPDDTLLERLSESRVR